MKMMVVVISVSIGLCSLVVVSSSMVMMKVEEIGFWLVRFSEMLLMKMNMNISVMVNIIVLVVLWKKFMLI